SLSWTVRRYPKAKITQIVFQKCKSLSKKMQVKPTFSFVTSNGRPGASKRKESSYGKVRSMLWKAGIGTRFRNIWNGRWWVHVRFCSVRCEGIYEGQAKRCRQTTLAHLPSLAAISGAD